MKLDIVKYGDPVLQKEGEEITNIDGQLTEFISNMFETMYEAKGVGLPHRKSRCQKNFS